MKIEEVEQAEGAMPIAEVLHHKIRYFSDGVVLGSADFVNRTFERERHRFGPKRKDGAPKDARCRLRSSESAASSPRPGFRIDVEDTVPPDQSQSSDPSNLLLLEG